MSKVLELREKRAKAWEAAQVNAQKDVSFLFLIVPKWEGWIRSITV